MSPDPNNCRYDKQDVVNHRVERMEGAAARPERTEDLPPTRASSERLAQEHTAIINEWSLTPARTSWGVRYEPGDRDLAAEQALEFLLDA